MFKRIVAAFLHPERAEMRPIIGYQPGLGENGIFQRRNIGKAAEYFWILAYQLIIQMRQELVGIGTADNGHNAFHTFVGKCSMNIGDAFFNGT